MIIKISILQKLKEGPWGGGNQFLKAVRDEFIKRGVYEENPEKADVILFNSFPSGEEHLFNYARKLKLWGKILIHRIDGPVFFVRQKDLEIDKLIYRFNDFFADGTVFQSNWSKQGNIKLGIKRNKFEKVITNAPNPDIFNRGNKIGFSKERKIKIICTSWSANIRKGFKIYEYLDENLDFSKYEMVFCGNSPMRFKNIAILDPLPTDELARELKKSDIFITASQSDACPNSLIEALHCGLPAVAINDGGHPEIVKHGGVLFKGNEDVIQAIDKLADNYDYYQSRINVPCMSEVSEIYYKFAKSIYDEVKSHNYKIKTLNFFRAGIFYLYFLWFKLFKKFFRK